MVSKILRVWVIPYPPRWRAAGWALLFGVLAEEVAPECYGTNIEFLAGRGLIRSHRSIKRVAPFTAVEFSILAKFLQSRFLFLAVRKPQRVVVIPSLQVPEAQLTLGVFFVTGALPRFLVFHLQRCCTHCTSLPHYS